MSDLPARIDLVLADWRGGAKAGPRALALLPACRDRITALETQAQAVRDLVQRAADHRADAVAHARTLPGPERDYALAVIDGMDVACGLLRALLAGEGETG